MKNGNSDYHELTEAMADLLEGYWQTYLKKSNLKPREESEHLSAFFAGGRAILDALPLLDALMEEKKK